MESEADRRAACGCGQLGIRCHGEPISVSLCHCPACQRRTGSPFGIAAFFDSANVEITGDSQRYVRGSDSGHDLTFHFCPICGGTPFWYPHRKPGVVAVAVGAFADPAFPPPAKAVYGAHRHAWLPTSGVPWEAETS